MCQPLMWWSFSLKPIKKQIYVDTLSDCLFLKITFKNCYSWDFTLLSNLLKHFFSVILPSEQNNLFKTQRILETVTDPTITCLIKLVVTVCVCELGQFILSWQWLGAFVFGCIVWRYNEAHFLPNILLSLCLSTWFLTEIEISVTHWFPDVVLKTDCNSFLW